MDFDGAGLDGRAEVGAGVGEIAAVEGEADGGGFAGGELEALEAPELEDRAGDGGDRVADEEEDGRGARAEAGVGEGGLDLDGVARG